MAFSVQPYYVLGRHNGQHWVLGSYSTLEQAKRAASWQDQPRPSGTPWVIANHKHGGDFYPLTGGKIDFPLTAYPYTEEAYARAMTAHGIDPRHMKRKA